MVRKVAVVGSGISGLVSAHSLRESGFDVSLFEKECRIGFDGHGISIRNGVSTDSKIDVPLRLLNPHQWPQLAKLYKRIGVETVRVNVSQAFCDVDGKCYLKISGNGLFGISPTQFLSRRARDIFGQINTLRDKGLKDIESRLIESSTTFSEWLNSNGFSDDFRLRFLFPVLSSTVCTCSYSALEQYPAIIMLDALARITKKLPDQKHFLSRTKYGSEDVVSRLTTNINQIRFGKEVLAVEPDNVGINLRFRTNDLPTESSENFDYVILATQANQALRFLPSPLRSDLEQIEYESVEVVIHRDRRLLGKEEKDWAAFNYTSNECRGSCTIWLSKYYDDVDGIPKDYFQTINPLVEPDDSLVVQRISLQRPVVNLKSFELWQHVADSYREKGQRLFLVGSYATPGIPLLENGVCSSISAVEAILNSVGNKMIVGT